MLNARFLVAVLQSHACVTHYPVNQPARRLFWDRGLGSKDWCQSRSFLVYSRRHRRRRSLISPKNDKSSVSCRYHSHHLQYISYIPVSTCKYLRVFVYPSISIHPRVRISAGSTGTRVKYPQVTGTCGNYPRGCRYAFWKILIPAGIIRGYSRINPSHALV